MSPYISLVLIVPRVPQEIHAPREDGDTFRRRRDTIPGIYVILGADMHKPQRPWGKPGYRVVIMRCSEILAHVLICDVIAQRRSCDTWRTVRVEIGSGTRLSDFGGRNVSDGAAETVTYDDDSVGWVSGGGGLEGRENAGAGFEPAIVAMAVFSFSLFASAFERGG